jgi:hypothetical protein
VVPEILEGALDPRISPRGILFRHPPDQLADFGKNAATGCFDLSVGPFPGHELPVPAEQCVRRDDRRDVAKCLPAYPVRSRGKSLSIVIGEP